MNCGMALHFIHPFFLHSLFISPSPSLLLLFPLQAKRPPILKKQMMAIYRTLVTKADKDGRLLCELFMRRPSPKVYPEYYLVIKQPIDFREILHKIRTVQVCK